MRPAIGLLLLGWTLLSCGPKPAAPIPATPAIANLKELQDYVSTADALPEDVEGKALAFIKAERFPREIADALPMDPNSFERVGKVVSLCRKKTDELVQKEQGTQAIRFLSLAIEALARTADRNNDIVGVPVKSGKPKEVKANRTAGLFTMKCAAFSEIMNGISSLESHMPKNDVISQTFDHERETEQMNQESLTRLQGLLKSKSYDQILEQFGYDRVNGALTSLHKALSLLGR